MHEFMREAEDLQGRPASQKQAVRGGESLGEDCQDALVRRGRAGRKPRGRALGAGGWLGCVEKGALAHEPWLRTGPLGRVGRPCSHPTPHGPDVTEVPHSPGCLLSRQLGATLSPTPLSPQRFCTKFAEMGSQRVATRQQLAESLLECGHSAAPKARQMQQDLQ